MLWISFEVAESERARVRVEREKEEQKRQGCTGELRDVSGNSTARVSCG